nr:restriction endonuclease subunit S [uncultured Bacteroides sp.]
MKNSTKLTFYMINDNLEKQAQAIFKSWFVDFEPFQDGEFVDSELGMIPKGWHVSTLDSFCSLISKGITPKYLDNTGERVIGQKCIRYNKIDLSQSREHFPKSINERWLRYGDILVNSTGTGTLGRVAQVHFIPRKLVVDSHVTIIRAKEELSISYLGGLLCTKQALFESMASGSTGQTDLPREMLKGMLITIPPISIQQRFSEFVSPINSQIVLLQDETSKLACIRDTLLPKLMSGELSVEDI